MPPAVGWLLHRRPPLRRSLVVALLGGALIAALAVAPVTGQLLTRLRPLATPVEHRSVSERGVLQAVAVDIIAMHPLTGVGAGNFSPAMLGAGAPFPPQPVHSVPLLVAAEVGVLGGGLWLWLWLVPGMALTRHFRRAGSWAVALVSAWFALGVIGLWDAYPWALNAGRLLSATLLGLVSRALGHGEGGPSDVETSAQ
jgi:O-antigen ligase